MAANNRLNIIVLGNGAVGKTSLLKMYAENKFQDSHMATLGLDYVSKTYTPKGSDQELQVKIWDTAGQERFRTLTHAFYKQANGVVVTFDVTNEESFKDFRKWMESIYEHADPNICKVMVGNKIDLDDRRVQTNDARDMATQYKMKYFEASAKQNIGIAEFFEELMTQVYKKRQEGEERRETIKIDGSQSGANGANGGEKKGGCC